MLLCSCFFAGCRPYNANIQRRLKAVRWRPIRAGTNWNDWLGQVLHPNLLYIAILAIFLYFLP